MLLRRTRTAPPAGDAEVVPGPSLAKGPAMLIGTILVAFGLTGLLHNADFPSASSSFPDGTVQGSSWLGIEVNGWTCFFSITAGALLLLGAAQHHLAKTMSLLVGLALVACAVIALSDGQDVLGLAAADGMTKLAFAIAGGALLLNALMPRRTRTVPRTATATTTAAAGTPAAAAGGSGHRLGRFRRSRPVREEPVDPGGEPVAATAPEDRTTVAPPRA